MIPRTRHFSNTPAVVVLTLALGLVVPVTVAAAEDPAMVEGPVAPEASTATDQDDEAGTDKKSLVDRSYGSVDNAVQQAVNAVDSFFVDSEQSTFNDRKTRIRLRFNTDYIQRHGWEFSPKVKLHLVLPGLNERLRLVMNDDQDEGSDQAPAADDDNDVALRWIGKQSAKRGYSFDLGLRIKSGTPDPFGRINVGLEYDLTGKWVGQSTNRLYYYSKTGVRNDFRQYFNRGLTDDLLFRSRTRLQYFEENDKNPYIEQKFSLFQSIREGRKIAYEAIYQQVSVEDSPFDEDEILEFGNERFNHYQLQLRLRQQAFRPWFFVEVWPAVFWAEEQKYDTLFGARIRLEINLGGSGDQRLDE